MNNINDDDILTPDQKRIRELEEELAQKEREKEVLEQDREYQRKVIAKQSEIIARAKNISSIIRPSLSRVKRLCDSACLDVQKVQGGYELSFGSTLKRLFKKLSHIFDILVGGDWYLSDIFKPDYFASNQYEYISAAASFNSSVADSVDNSNSVSSKENSISLGSLTGLAVSAFRGLASQAKQKLSSTPFADSYTDETLNQAQNSYDTWDESLDDFSPA